MIYLSSSLKKKKKKENPDLFFRFYDILSGFAGQKCEQIQLASLQEPEIFGLQKLPVLFFKNMSILHQDLHSVKVLSRKHMPYSLKSRRKTFC